jgi:hypothetical protein
MVAGERALVPSCVTCDPGVGALRRPLIKPFQKMRRPAFIDACLCARCGTRESLRERCAKPGPFRMCEGLARRAHRDANVAEAIKDRSGTDGRNAWQALRDAVEQFRWPGWRRGRFPPAA